MFLCHRLQSYSSSSPPDYDWLKQIFEGSKHETAYYLDHTSGSGTLPRDRSSASLCICGILRTSWHEVEDLTIFTTQTHIRLLSVSSIQYSPNIGSTKYFCYQRQNFVLLLTLNVCRWINLCICQQNLVLSVQKMISKQLPEFGSGRNAKVGAN